MEREEKKTKAVLNLYMDLYREYLYWAKIVIVHKSLMEMVGMWPPLTSIPCIISSLEVQWLISFEIHQRLVLESIIWFLGDGARSAWLEGIIFPGFASSLFHLLSASSSVRKMLLSHSLLNTKSYQPLSEQLTPFPNHVQKHRLDTSPPRCLI